MAKSIITDLDICYICHSPASETHHCVFGRFRKLADRYGLVVPLCRRCHEHVHNDAATALRLKQIAQRAFDEKYGEGEFPRIFGVNFIE